ncbi:hypothetical protein XELAEV_18026146mg [Xenopus laevis]|uniref:Secreted protein n=1 Tax=Xenopus laevis TaxID=8355 RepID=A0A974CTD6_XENLA|nr:hypothetical protein XELAEV_18026146mg [Xenopus laevis]
MLFVCAFSIFASMAILRDQNLHMSAVPMHILEYSTPSLKVPLISSERGSSHNYVLLKVVWASLPMSISADLRNL